MMPISRESARHIINTNARVALDVRAAWLELGIALDVEELACSVDMTLRAVITPDDDCPMDIDY